MTSHSRRAALGRAIRAARAESHVTLRDLAACVGVSPATLSAIENGRSGCTTERLLDLADALGVGAGRLLDEVPRPPRSLTAKNRHEALERRVPRDAGTWRAYEPMALDPALSAALGAFLDVGYHGATMRDIAQRAGLSVAGLYHYYPSKQRLLWSLFDVTMSDLACRTSQALSEFDDPAGRLACLVECHVLFHVNRRELGFVGASEMRSLEGTARRTIARLRSHEQRKLDRAVVDGVERGLFATAEPHHCARAIVAMCTSLSFWCRRDGALEQDVVASQYVEFALDLVRCEPGARPRRGRPEETCE